MTDTPFRVSPSAPQDDVVDEAASLESQSTRDYLKSVAARSPSSPAPSRGTEPEDFEELLDELVNQAELSPALKLWDKLAAARQRVESHVSRLREERDALQQTELTAEERDVLINFLSVSCNDCRLTFAAMDVLRTVLAKLRSLAALRSLEGEGK